MRVGRGRASRTYGVKLSRDPRMRLVIEDVSKIYKGKVWGLSGFSLDLGPGILGLLGPNGAGKSTLMRILACVTKPTTGRVFWDGVDVVKSPDALRAVLGYLPQDFGVYPQLNAIEFLEYIAFAKGLDRRIARRRIDELLNLLNLNEARKRPLGSYSGGARQRIGIAQALLNDPKLLVIDEPTSGLDPEERVRFRKLLSDLAGDRIIILSTHIVSDAEAAATELAIISEGRLLTHTTPELLLQAVEGKVWECLVPSSELLSLGKHYIVSGTIRRKEGVQVRLVSDIPPHANADRVPPSIEDAYLHFIAANRGAYAQ